MKLFARLKQMADQKKPETKILSVNHEVPIASEPDPSCDKQIEHCHWYFSNLQSQQIKVYKGLVITERSTGGFQL